MLRQFTVDTADGYSHDFEAGSEQEAKTEAERVVNEEFGCAPGTHYEIWDTEVDQCVGTFVVSR